MSFVSRVQKAYTSTAHRDLDETAVSNLAARRARIFLNFWLPLAPVIQDHLGICLPDSVDLSADPGGFKGLEGDRTGLRHRANHRWFYVPNMGPGDVLIWRSEVVYHASLVPVNACSIANPGLDIGSERRKSIDLRLIYYEDPKL